MLFDIHIHSNISPCSSLKLDDIINKAKKIGLDGICITDHDSMEAKTLICEGMQKNGLYVIIGMEYSTSDGDFLIFGINNNIPLNLTAEKLLIWVKKSKGAAIAAHPFRKVRPAKEYTIKSKLCNIVESINGRNTSIENSKINIWRKKYNFTECGGSDAHTLQEIGKVKTRFFTDIRSSEDLVYALNNGLCIPEESVSNLGL
jgi:hypothetical protein